MNASVVKNRPRILEISVFIAMLIAANFTLIFGQACEPLVFFPAQVAAGEWWRILTFPLVHVSAYHLILDAGAFVFLYHGLMETSAIKRLGIIAACAAGSLGVSLISSPLTNGLCGLSGIAHGLMAISAIELIRTPDKNLQRAGITCLLVVVLKGMVEALSGQVLFENLHLGHVASPVAACHAGGILGGLLSKIPGSRHSCIRQSSGMSAQRIL